MLRSIAACLAALSLVACASPPTGPDFADCRADLAQASGLDTQRQRIAFIDACMARKGWKPTQACVEMMMQGTGFCDYVR